MFDHCCQSNPQNFGVNFSGLYAHRSVLLQWHNSFALLANGFCSVVVRQDSHLMNPLDSVSKNRTTTTTKPIKPNQKKEVSMKNKKV